jgi:hypothetical protein
MMRTLAPTSRATLNPTRKRVPKSSLGQMYLAMSRIMAQFAFRCSRFDTVCSASNGSLLVVGCAGCSGFTVSGFMLSSSIRLSCPTLCCTACVLESSLQCLGVVAKTLLHCHNVVLRTQGFREGRNAVHLWEAMPPKCLAANMLHMLRILRELDGLRQQNRKIWRCLVATI